MSNFENVDPDALSDVDLSRFSVEEIVAGIEDRAASVWERDSAIAGATAGIAPKVGRDVVPEAEDMPLIDALTGVARDPDEPARLRERAGDSLGLVWMWSGEFDRKTFETLTPTA